MSENKHANAYSIHLIITIPTLKANQVYQYFDTAQTGFYYDDKCWKHELPNKVFQKISLSKRGEETKSFYSLDNVNCEGQSKLFMFCDLNINRASSNPLKLMEAQCLSETPNSCNMYPIKCEDKILYNMHGLLAMSHKQVKGVLKKIVDDRKITIWNPSNSTTKTSYWPWKIFEYVEFSSGVARANDYIGYVESASQEQQETWWRIIRNTNKYIESNNLTRAYFFLNRSLETLQKQKSWFNKDPTLFSKDIAIIIGITFSAIIVALVSILCIKRKISKKIKRGTKRKRDDKQSDTESEDDRKQIKQENQEQDNEKSPNIKRKNTPSAPKMSEIEESTNEKKEAATFKKRKTEHSSEEETIIKHINPYQKSMLV